MTDETSMANNQAAAVSSLRLGGFGEDGQDNGNPGENQQREYLTQDGSCLLGADQHIQVGFHLDEGIAVGVVLRGGSGDVAPRL